MKNILLLYKKLYNENKTIIILYLLLLIIVSVIIFMAQFQSYTKLLERENKVWLYNLWLDNSVIVSLIIISISLGISIHWGIRHFNYSPQRYQYNTMPISSIQKFGFMCTYAFIVLPVLHTLIVGGVFLLTSKVSILDVFNKTSWELLLGITHNIKMDIDKWFFLVHLHIFIALYILVSLFFNKMGFIKTAVAGFVIMMVGTLLFVFLNEKLWEKQGGFATMQSVERFPSLYTMHYICIAIFFVGILYVIYTRLTDKNY